MFLIRGMWKLIKLTMITSIVGVVALVALVIIGEFLPTEKEKLAAMSSQERIEYLAEREVEKAARVAENIRLEEKNNAAIAVLVAEVKQVPAADFDINIDYYKRLVRLAPGNETFKRKLAHYQTKEQQRVAEIAANAAAREAEFAADAAIIKARREAARNLLASAYMICKKSVLAQANYASKADFNYGIEGFVSLEGNGRVIGTVELMNGFGAMIPQRFVCAVKDRMVSAATLANN